MQEREKILSGKKKKRALAARKLYVSLDRADAIIEGGLVLHAAIAQFANATHRGYLENQVHGTFAPPQDLPDEVIEAQNRVAVNGNQLLVAISHHQFAQACFYKNEERKARENLRQMQEKYGIGDPQPLP